MNRFLWLALALTVPVAAEAQTVTVTSPNTVDGQGRSKAVTDVFVRNADGTIANASGINRATSTVSSGSTTAANTYQTALPASSARLGCLLQNTSSVAMRVYVGAATSATDAAAFQIAAGGSFNCASPSGVIVTDPISVSSSAAGSSYVVVSQ